MIHLFGSAEHVPEEDDQPEQVDQPHGEEQVHNQHGRVAGEYGPRRRRPVSAERGNHRVAQPAEREGRGAGQHRQPGAPHPLGEQERGLRLDQRKELPEVEPGPA